MERGGKDWGIYRIRVDYKGGKWRVQVQQCGLLETDAWIVETFQS